MKLRKCTFLGYPATLGDSKGDVMNWSFKGNKTAYLGPSSYVTQRSCDHQNSMNISCIWTVLGYHEMLGDSKGDVINWSFIGNKIM